MKRTEDAEHLAKMMVETGERMGKRMAALITGMDQPLGRTVGNSLEVRECIEILRGDWHPMSEDLRTLSIELAAWMFYLGGLAATVEAGRTRAEEILASGKALAKFEEMCRLQGGDPSNALSPATFATEFKASETGFITGIHCEQVGLASLVLGGGRNKQDDLIDPQVGLELRKKVGDAVQLGEPIATVHYNDSTHLASASQLLKEAYRIGPAASAAPRQLVRKVIEGQRRKP
jgi:pyrimidine-nucleoside phosphorylase